MVKSEGSQRRFTAPAAAAILIAIAALAPAPQSRAQTFADGLEEVRQLIESNDYRTALEDLKFLSQQIQDLRVAAVVPFFPHPPRGWVAEPPLRTSGRDDPWSMRLEVRRRYQPEEGAGRLEIVLDFFSPLLPSVTMGMNPVYLAADSLTEPLEIQGAPGRVRFSGDTGEGDLILILDRRILITVIGRGIERGSLLREFASLIDFEALRTSPPP